MSERLETIKVKREGGRGYRLINKIDFDPKGHEEIEGSGQAPAKEITVEQSGSGEEFSDEQLREAIKEATGKAPHHKTGRAKLVAQFNELNLQIAA